MKHDDNIDLWLENSERLNAKRRCILVTQWVGETYIKLLGEDYKDTRYRGFKKTGCLIIADGSENSEINPEGFKNYFVPPPLLTVLAEQPQTCPVPEGSPNEELSFEEQPRYMAYEESEDNKEQKNDKRIDNENNRIYKNPLKNRKLRILYQE